MKLYEDVQEIRKRRVDTITELKADVKELAFLETRLNEKLPHQHLLSEAVKKIPKLRALN